VPVACTLGPGDGQASRRRWRRPDESATSSARIVAGTLQVRYQPGPGVQEELTALAAAEQPCCSFLGWSVTNSDGQLVLLASAPAEAPDAVAPMAATFGAADAPTNCPADRTTCGIPVQQPEQDQSVPLTDPLAAHQPLGQIFR